MDKTRRDDRGLNYNCNGSAIKLKKSVDDKGDRLLVNCSGNEGNNYKSNDSTSNIMSGIILTQTSIDMMSNNDKREAFNQQQKLFTIKN